MELLLGIFFVLVIIPLACLNDVQEMEMRRQTEEANKTLDKDK